jgi:hypothetical protein
MNTGQASSARPVFMDSGLAAPRRPGMTTGMIVRISCHKQNIALGCAIAAAWQVRAKVKSLCIKKIYA